MSVASREAAGYLSKVGWYVDHGFGVEKFAEDFGALGPGESYLTINAVWLAGLKAHRAGQLAADPDTTGRVPVSQIPGRSETRQRYRYTVLVTYQAPAGQANVVRTMTLVNASQMTTAELMSAAQAGLPTTQAPRVNRRSGTPIDNTWTVASVEVQTLERWT